MTREATVVLADADATAALGARLAAALPPRLVIYLEGDLGAGKTTLTRALLHAAGHEGRVRSPTYTLIEPYRLGERAYYHLDLYRLADPEELEYLGLRDLLVEPCVLLIEWPSRGQGMLPPPDLIIRLRPVGDGREAALSAASPAGEEVLSRLGVI